MKLPQPYRKKFSRILLFGFLMVPIWTSAQEIDKSTNFQEDFKKFKSSIGLQFDTFVQHNDSVFIQFLSKSWKELLGVQNKLPAFPKPVQQPRVSSPSVPETPLKIDTSNVTPTSKTEQLVPKKKDLVPLKVESFFTDAALSSFNFYGTEISVPIPSTGLPVLNLLSREGIINFFVSAANYPLLGTVIKKVKESSANCKLNDWGLTSMLMLTSQKLYDTLNEQVLFTWYALIRNGINAKVGYNKERVYLLLPTTEKVYSISYIINNISYYLFDVDLSSPKASLLTIYEADYPGNRNDFSFLITETPQLGNQCTTKVIGTDSLFKLTINKNLIDFYCNYPTCDLKIFFAAPLSESILSQLDRYFNPLLKDKNDDERVAFLLNFVQYNIKYQTDQEQFGHEKYLFAEESFFYPASDCEDRAILLSKLIRHYTRLETIGLLYPEHVSLAVNISEVPACKYFTYHNKRFYNCDPTYLGALCGTIMPKFISSEPEIID